VKDGQAKPDKKEDPEAERVEQAFMPAVKLLA
jgi:hypothetical protein